MVFNTAQTHIAWQSETACGLHNELYKTWWTPSQLITSANYGIIAVIACFISTKSGTSEQ